MRNKRLTFWDGRISEALPWFTGALVVLSGNWAASAIYDSLCLIFSASQTEPSGLRISYIVAFIVFVILFVRQRKNLFPPHTRYLTRKKMEKRKHLVLSLSYIGNALADIGGVPENLNIKFESLIADVNIITKYKANKPNWTWEMPIRAILHHASPPRKLESVTILCSRKTTEGTIGSINQLKFFYNIYRKYAELSSIPLRLLGVKDDSFCVADVTEEMIANYEGLNFEDFDELSLAFDHLLSDFKTKAISEKDIVIDITGGQKPTSIVGAAITVNRRIKAQYVQTNYPWEVISYDVIQATSDTGGLGL